MAFALLVGSLLTAAEAEARLPDEARLYAENDVFNWFTESTDRYYTHGMRLEWLWHRQRADRQFLPGITHADWCRLLCGDGAFEGGDRNDGVVTAVVDSGFSIGQNIYTPEDVTNPAPQPNDRPWAGLLYGSRMARISYGEPSLKARRQDQLEVTLGIVGPASLAGDLQILWHETWDFTELAGWDNQLRNEPVLQLRYETALRWPPEGGGNADVVPRLRVNLGNALTSLEADLTGRLGWNLSGFGVELNRPAPPPPAAFRMDRRTNPLTGFLWPRSFNVFGRLGMKAVAHNIVLDGNTFASNDIRIERKTFVPEYALGAEVNLVSNLWLSFQFIHRGSEFETRSGRDAPAQQFGAFTLAWRGGT